MLLIIPDMSTTAFIEPLPVVEFVAKILDKDVHSRSLSEADRVKVIFVMVQKLTDHIIHRCDDLDNFRPFYVITISIFMEQ